MIGNLNQLVIVERSTRTALPGGGWSQTWAPLCQVWAEIWTDGTRERVAAMREQAAGMVHVRLWRTVLDEHAITTADRMVWRAQTMNIRGIADPGPPAIVAVLDCEIGAAG